MNKNHIRGRRDEMSWHNTAKSPRSVPEVNVAAGWRRFPCLPGEISTARGRESGSAGRSNALGDGREVSRGHIARDGNRGAEIRPYKLRNPQARSGKGRTDTMGRPGHPPTAMKPNGGAMYGNGSRAEKESPCTSAAVPQGEAAYVRHLKVR